MEGKAKSSGSNLNSKWLGAKGSSTWLEAWEVMLGPGQEGDARLGSGFKVAAELSGLGTEDGGEAAVLPAGPEEPLALATFLGFRFRVWMLSFFIARGLGTPCSFV